MTDQSIQSADKYGPEKYPLPHWPEWVALALYAALVAFAIPSHEPWADEAQAWQLARNLPLADLFNTYIRFEGSPGLWHFFLWILVHLHIGYTGMHWACGVIAVTASALLIFKSPFPRYLKLPLPFTFFLVFQYAVVARNYVLAPILLYLIAICWKKSPAVVALLLGLLANVSLHNAAISGGLACVYLIEQTRAGAFKGSRRRQFPIFTLIVVCFYAFALWTAWPPKALSEHMAHLHSSSMLPAAWIAVSLFWGIWQPWQLSIIFWIAIVLCFIGRRRLFFLLPVAFFAAFSGAAHANWWHVGLLVPLLIALLWITWPAPGFKLDRREVGGRIAMALLAAIQIAWAANAIQFDHYNAYSPDLAAAEYLRPYVQQGALIAVTYWDDPDGQACHAVGILPYFDHNIFANLPDPFWSWGNNNPTEDRFNAMLPSHPKIVLVETRNLGPIQPTNMNTPRIQSLLGNGYNYVSTFCGTFTETFGSSLTNCHVVFEYPGTSPNPKPFAQAAH